MIKKWRVSIIGTAWLIICIILIIINIQGSMLVGMFFGLCAILMIAGDVKERIEDEKRICRGTRKDSHRRKRIDFKL